MNITRHRNKPENNGSESKGCVIKVRFGYDGFISSGEYTSISSSFFKALSFVANNLTPSFFILAIPLGVGPQQVTVIINKQTTIGLLLGLKHPFLGSKWGF